MIMPNIINITPKPYRKFLTYACVFPSGVDSFISMSNPFLDSINDPTEIDITSPIIQAIPINNIIRLPIPLLIFYHLLFSQMGFAHKQEGKCAIINPAHKLIFTGGR